MVDDEVMEGEGVERRKTEDADKLFNPQVLFATSGAANAGIDNPDIYGVLRVEMPPFLEDCVHEQGQADRRPGSNAESDSYTICVSFEPLLKLWCRIYSGTIDKLSYQERLLFDLEITLECNVLPTHYFLSVFADRIASPFDHKPGQIRYLPPPCLTSCSFCTGEYDKLFPPIIRGGVCAVIMDLFSGENRISVAITFDPVLIRSIIKYKGFNCLVFGVKSDKNLHQ